MQTRVERAAVGRPPRARARVLSPLRVAAKRHACAPSSGQEARVTPRHSGGVGWRRAAAGGGIQPRPPLRPRAGRTES